MFGKKFQEMNENLQIIEDILKLETTNEMHEELDRLVNSVHIFYESRDDFETNYPEAGDLKGKINLVMTRRK